MSEGRQHRLAAILSADVVGYLRLMGADEAGTRVRLKALDDRKRDAHSPYVSYGNTI